MTPAFRSDLALSWIAPMNGLVIRPSKVPVPPSVVPTRRGTLPLDLIEVRTWTTP